ncbi:protein YIPF5-like [Ctenocephalides felis]|uniref:protein YIPF5-like n=1 Tax=Ctenocephalides felis TaxID=7515 RepID=UPI000E6E2DD1|nr:protein YIPF5-like [Ctenocephalides felis]
MAQYNPNEYWNQQNPPDHSYNFEVPDDFGFQSFDNDPNQQPLSNQNQMYPNVPFTPTENVYTGQVYDPNLMPKTDQYSHGGGGGEFDDEPPLLEELGINPDHILKKTLSVLNPKEDPDPNFVQRY